MHTNRAIALFYLGLTFGDIASGVTSQLLKSRLKAVTIFISYSLVLVFIYLFLMTGVTSKTMYTLIFFMGIGMGYWTVFVTIAAEGFGTNLRATVATTVPNFARGSLVPITGIFTGLTKPDLLSPNASAIILTVLCFGGAYIALWRMEETYGKDLNYLEIQLTTKE
jgi:MFS transporter, putative metabolite:H+ symporter